MSATSQSAMSSRSGASHAGEVSAEEIESLSHLAMPSSSAYPSSISLDAAGLQAASMSPSSKSSWGTATSSASSSPIRTSSTVLTTGAASTTHTPKASSSVSGEEHMSSSMSDCTQSSSSSITDSSTTMASLTVGTAAAVASASTRVKSASSAESASRASRMRRCLAWPVASAGVVVHPCITTAPIMGVWRTERYSSPRARLREPSMSSSAARFPEQPPHSERIWSRLRYRVLFQWFLMALSVRPGSSLAISVHLLPWISCALTMRTSSSSVHGPRLIEGSSWFL
mmetsp:Transcript_30302/g.59181  ORF Transcript_30302/g.59181 Transcript_30302/m.59181 type:complete len:285 (+) Transcript_30302:1553-2407(+)